MSRLLPLLCASACAGAALAATSTVSVYMSPSGAAVKAGVLDPSAAAVAQYSPAADHVSNFAVLDVKTYQTVPDQQAIYAAGFAEGFLTAPSIADVRAGARRASRRRPRHRPV